MKIISIDGGGIRGIIPADILRRVEERSPGCLQEVDLYAGTSTGAILSAALAAGLKPSDIVELYRSRGPDIFDKRDWLDSVAFGADEFFRADYSLDGLEAALFEYLGNMTLGDLQKRVILTTIRLSPTERVKVKVFHNFDGPGNDRHVRVIDAVLGSAAAPVYFPAHPLPTETDPESKLIDGGLSLNSPALAAIGQALDGGYLLEDISMISLGCGDLPLIIGGGDWGMKQWGLSGGIPLLTLMFESQLGTVDYVASRLLRDSYHRLNPMMDEDISMDDAASIPKLLSTAQSVGDDQIDQLVCRLLGRSTDEQR